MLHWKYTEFLDSSIADNYLKIFRSDVGWATFAPSPNSRLVQIWSPERNSKNVNDIIQSLIQRLKDLCHVTECQGVFMNNYNNGNDHCPHHKDQYNCDVYTISLGTSRDLLIKRGGVEQQSEKITLNSGDLYYLSKRSELYYSTCLDRCCYICVCVIIFATHLPEFWGHAGSLAERRVRWSKRVQWSRRVQWSTGFWCLTLLPQATNNNTSYGFLHPKFHGLISHTL